MTSSSFAAEAGHDPNPNSTAPSYNTAPAHALNISSPDSNNKHNSPNGTGAANTSSVRHENSNSVFHAHRQNHNSSKLPAFRFADLKKDALVLPSLLQHMPPSPVSPNPAPNTADDESPRDAIAHDQTQRISGSLPDSLHQHQNPNNHNNRQNPADKPASFETPPSVPQFLHHPGLTRSRTSTIQPPSATTSSRPSVKRPASFPDSPSLANISHVTVSKASSTATPVAKRRLTTSVIADGAETLSPLKSALNSSRLHAVETAQPTDPAEKSTKEWAQGQRELVLPKTVESAKSDDKRKSRPPVSYRPPTVATASGGGRAVIPPIRSFRSSGSRKSLVLDMHTRRASDDSFGSDITDPNQRDRTLRALEGRGDDDYSQITPPDSADPTTDNENTADIFMNIAREDSARRQMDERGAREDQSAISRVTRSSHRRPLSAAVPIYQATSPPQITRRLSDQRENSRNRKLTESQSAQQITRELNHRATTRERQAPTITAAPEDSGRSQTARTPLRPSPITRQIYFQDASPDGNSPYSRRRPSIPDSNSGYSASRTAQYKNVNPALGQGRAYNSSPLVPKSTDFQKHDAHHAVDTNHGVEGTESSASTTAAPSTVWDELDDLKSRIHRLELTGKIPPTSGAAMSRASDDRPPTATTNATTMSASPKRGSGAGAGTGAGAAQIDVSSTTSSQRESQPILLSALSKTKGLVSSEVFDAIETAATEALALSNMMGAPGQPGPISSGASTVGGGGSITDRQLRRRTDNICRSLTELCIALADEMNQVKKAPQQPQTMREKEAPKGPSALAVPKRQVTMAESTIEKSVTSPRAPTSLEQRRMTMLGAAALPSPRFVGAPLTPLEPTSAGRKSSLLLARTRRAGTEELEEASGRRSSLLLRTRRAGTEEPEIHQEHGRKTSLLLRSRKRMNEEDEDESRRFRAPSRATTEVNSFRAAARDRDLTTQGQTSPPDNSSLGSSALPRRRLVSSSFNPRLVTPSTPTSAGSMQRRFLDRTTPATEREPTNSVAEKLAEDRGQRQFSLSHTAMLNRTGSISNRQRESGIPSLPSLQQNTQQNGGVGGVYR